MLHKCKLIKSKRKLDRMRFRILRIQILSYKYNAEYASHNQYYTRYNYPYLSMFHAFHLFFWLSIPAVCFDRQIIKRSHVFIDG